LKAEYNTFFVSCFFDKYIGELKEGKYHGQGKLIYYHGAIIYGIWSSGKFFDGIEFDKEGKVIAIWSNGVKEE
jgi:hypothetical protein